MKITINRIGRDALEGEAESLFAFCEKHKKDLRGADLSNADLSNADLSGAVLSDAVLSDAVLSDAVLSGADLRWTDLRGAVLCGADLRGADLRGAVLRGAVLCEAELRRAYLDYASWPLSCGSFNLGATDDRLTAQLLQHTLHVVLANKSEYGKTVVKALLPLQRFHGFRNDVKRIGKEQP